MTADQKFKGNVFAAFGMLLGILVFFFIVLHPEVLQ